MRSERMKKTIIAGLVLCLAVAQSARADSAANDHVRVSCGAPGVSVTVDGNHFHVLAPGQPDSFTADVGVVAINGWELVSPPAADLPLSMKGGSTAGYKVRRDPEDQGSGTIAFHNYHIESNVDGGAKVITVVAGASVTYTAYRNQSTQASNWTVNGPNGAATKGDTSKIIFNRNWWDVAGWFIPSMDTPIPGVYDIEAKDVDFPALTDSGSMTVVGVRRITGPNGKASERVEAPPTWSEGEVVYAQPCAVFSLTAELEPGLTAAESDKAKSSVAWSAGSGRITPNSSNPLVAEHCAPEGAGTYTVTASCGESKRIILIKVGVPKIHQVSFAGNIGIGRDTSGVLYTGPAWKDDDLDGTSDLVGANANASKPYQPVAYLSTRTLSATGVFLPDCMMVSDPAQRISAYDAEAAVQKLRFAPNTSIWGWDWSAPVLFNMGGTAVTAASPFRSAAEVGYESNYELAWEVGFGEAGTADGGLAWHRSRSNHELYLTYNAEVASYETVFHLSCTSASGRKTAPTVIEGVWSGFSGKGVKRKDGTKLTYYKSYRINVVSLGELLNITDGQCRAWAYFFRETLRIHGMSAEWKKFVPSMADGFLVKTWSFSGAGTSGDATFPYRNDVKGSGVGLWTNYTLDTQYDWGTVAEVTYTSGTPGQNNGKPASLFGNHQIVYVPAMNAWYDPSYGMKHTTMQAIDDTLSGFLIAGGTHAFFIQKNPTGVQIQFQ